MNSCELLKHHLRKYGEQATRQHERLGPHLAECEHCRGLLEAWHRVPGLLDGLPDREPGDILQRRTLKAITQDDSSARPPMRRSPRMAASLATAAVLFAAVGISRHLIDSEYPRSPLPAFKEEYESLSGPLPEPPRSTTEVDYFRPGASDNPAQVIDEDGRIFGGHERSESVAEEQLDSNGLRRGQLAGNLAVESEPPADRQAAATRSYPGATGEGQDRSGHSEIFTDDAMEPAPRRSSVDTPGIASGTVDALRHMAKKPKTESDLEAGAKRDIREGESRERQLKDNAEQQHAYRQMREDKKASAGNYHGKAIEAPVINERLGSAHFDFDNTLEQLQFQPAEGYWANTHVPGDPAIRLLRSRLAQWDREGSKLLSGLEQDVRPLRQPFDAPADNALALSLMSDTSAVDGATRMRIQVGVRGIEHRRGQRPAMNMALVIDLPPGADDDSRIAARALLDAALASKQSGDRFSLVINGPESLVVTPEDFRFGPLQMARQAIAGNRQPLPDNDGNLAQAISQAASIVRQSDDPSLPLGSSSILLISAGGLDNSEQLASLVHGQAVEGITFSVVPLGDRPDNERVEQLVLAGLGHRRILDAPDQARQLVESELHASSRAVARAARLSIRLAPGVRLVDVIGSTRLDEQRSQRVRDIENSMDTRLSKNLGIEADRGDDEGGIQVVIPSIFSGDDVTILLDVVASQAGEIADVSLRYKDLVYLRNGKLSGQLSLPSGTAQRGAQQNSVTKSLLAFQFRAATARAADALGRRQTAEAAAILAAMRDEIAQLRAGDQAFSNDPDLLRDQQILERYIRVLGKDRAHTSQLADSLRYAAWAKTHRPPSEWK